MPEESISNSDHSSEQGPSRSNATGISPTEFVTSTQLGVLRSTGFKASRYLSKRLSMQTKKASSKMKNMPMGSNDESCMSSQVYTQTPTRMTTNDATLPVVGRCPKASHSATNRNNGLALRTTVSVARLARLTACMPAQSTNPDNMPVGDHRKASGQLPSNATTLKKLIARTAAQVNNCCTANRTVPACKEPTARLLATTMPTLAAM
mmetsp:Transcript_151799/g.487093  ORF Transcript_151799/g.487093 Transcript_151799/m.487093 type:complete len:207 (+) Transcript_151799:367-987(+)